MDAGEIGGPSAGLLIALTVYDLADERDLTDGRVIAGTGTIDGQGNVGPVGGVEQARAAAGDRLRIVEVATLQEAIDALQ